MLRFTFRGGIHPDDGKAMSKDKPIREVLLPNRRKSSPEVR